MLEFLEMLLILLLAIYVVVLLGKELGVTFKFISRERKFKNQKPMIFRYNNYFIK